MPASLARATSRCVGAEVTKLVTLRLSWSTVLATVVLSVSGSWGITRLAEAAERSGRPQDAGGLESGSAFLVILHYAQIGVVLFAAWIVHQETGPGLLRTTLIATPARGVVFAAKAGVVGATAAVAGLLSGVGSAVAAGVSGHPRALLGIVGYWTLLALLTYAVAVLVGSGVVALGAVLALVLAMSPYLASVSDWARYLPDRAGARLYLDSADRSDLGPVTGGLVLLAWTALALALAFVGFGRRGVRT